MPATILIDVTELMAQQGPAVGIVRIVQEIGAAFLGDAAARFCAYDSARECFVAVAPEALRERIENPPVRRAEPVAVAPDWRARLGEYLPPPLRGPIHEALRKMPRYRQKAAGESSPLLFPQGAVFVFSGFMHDAKRIAHYRRMVSEHALRVVFYCHDLIPVRFPNYVSRKTHGHFLQMLDVFLVESAMVICNSESTRRDVMAYATRQAITFRACEVVNPGHGLSAVALPSEPLSGRLAAWRDKPFVLYVSTVEKRKNHDLLYKAWLHLLEQGVRDLPALVFVGARGWIVDDFLHDLDHDPRIRACITILSDLDDSELAQLYRHALFTVYPSFYEGWGLPVSESLAFGRFCLCSDGGALPEAGAGFVEHLSPYDVSAWANRLRHYASQPALLQEKEERIRREYSPRPWQAFRDDIRAVVQDATR